VSDKLHDTSRLELMEHEAATVYDIGGMMTVTMKEGTDGFHGHYSKNGSNAVYMFDGQGMTRKQIIKTFWDSIKDNPVGGE